MHGTSPALRSVGEFTCLQRRLTIVQNTFFLLLLMLLTAVPVSAAPIELGASVQLTGQFANTGRYYGDAYQFTIDKINAAGGVKLGQGREKLTLKILDNQSDVNLSVRQYVQLLSQDKVNFLLG